MQLIDNGMFNMDEAIIVDGIDGSDDDNEMLGADGHANYEGGCCR